MKKSRKPCSTGSDNDQRGAAMVVAIFSMLLITVVAVALIANAMVSGNISTNSKQQTESYYISEAGLTHATKLLLAANPSQYNSILQAGDGVANTGDELSTRPTALTPIPLAGITFGNGKYVVKVSDDPADADGNPNADSNGRIVVTSIGYGQNGATVTTEAIVGVSVNSFPAILVNGNLRINGNTNLLGPAGSVHSNGSLTFVGNPCASQYFSSSSTITNPGNSRGGGCVGAGVNYVNQPIIPPPIYNIRADFYANSDYILGAIGAQAGKVYNGSTGALIHNTANTNNDWIVGSSRWTYDGNSKKWTHLGGSLPTGTYYSEGNMEVDDSFGTPASPVTATLIAEGYLSNSQNPFMRPDYLNYSMMAGTDLRISGSSVAGQTNFQGIHYAGHQIAFSGSPGIDGVAISANLADTNSPGCGCNYIPLVGGYIEISSQLRITNNGGLIWTQMPKHLSWREVRY